MRTETNDEEFVQREKDSTLLHELIHVWLFVHGKDADSLSHGKLFIWKMNRNNDVEL